MEHPGPLLQRAVSVFADTQSSQHASPACTFPAHHRLVRLHLPPGRQFPPASAPVLLGLPWSLSGKRIHRNCRRCRFNPCVRKIPWKRTWQPTPVFFPGKSHGQKGPVGYSPRGRKRVGHDVAAKQQQNYAPYRGAHS